MVKIYYKDVDERERLKNKYPDVEATWLPIPEDKLEEFADADGPIVCANDEPIDRCDIGEQHIERLAHLKKMKEQQ
jgi:hypothetical protein